MTPPVIVSSPPECAFYRSAGDAIAAGSAVGARTFDAERCRVPCPGPPKNGGSANN
jgi:hypothetical protein